MRYVLHRYVLLLYIMLLERLCEELAALESRLTNRLNEQSVTYIRGLELLFVCSFKFEDIPKRRVYSLVISPGVNVLLQKKYPNYQRLCK